MRIFKSFAGAWIVASALLAPAAAQNASYFVDIVEDGTSMAAIAVTDTNYAMAGNHTAYATLTLRSPTGRSQTLTAFQAPYVTVQLIMPIDIDDGYWIATNEPSEWCPVGNVYYYYPQEAEGRTVNPFVELLPVGPWNPSTVDAGSSSSLSATVQSSRNAAQNTQVQLCVMRAYSSPLLQQQTTFSPSSACHNLIVGQGGGQTGSFTLFNHATQSENGSLIATPYIHSVNPSADIKEPPALQTTQTLTIRKKP